MKIRTATKQDIPELAELLHELFAIETDFSPDFAAQSRGLTLLLEKECAEVFVAETEGKVVGMCTVQLLVSTAKGGEVGVVEDVVIDIDYRGRGFAGALLRKLEEWAVERGLLRLQLQADRTNSPALGLYRHLDWQATNLVGWMKQM